MMQIVFLGTGAGCGVPSLYCDCAACEEARQQPHLGRSRCSIVVQGKGTTLIDAPPELRTQLVREGVKEIDQFILTHWHFDHFGGIGDLEFYMRMKRKEAIPTVMTRETRQAFEQGFGYMADCLQVYLIEHGSTWELDDLSCTLLRAQHAPGTVCVLLEHEGRKTAYIPDSGPLPEETAVSLQNLNTLIIDATFWGNNWMPEQHHSVQSAIETGQALNAKQIYLTHLSMHYDQPVTDRELTAYVSQFGDHVHLAYDGLRIDI